MKRFRVFGVGGVVLLAVGGLLSPSHVAASVGRAVARPAGFERVFVGKATPTTASCEQKSHIACYAPSQIQHAYDMEPLFTAGLDGTGRTIAIVDSYGSPTIKHDLKVFDKAFGLPDPPSLKTIFPAGPVPPFDKHDATMRGWAEETTLDVEWAHAMAPGADILVVATPVAETEGVVGFPQIVKAENSVIANGQADVISQSFGATEPTFPSAAALMNLRSAYVNAQTAGITVLASSGDAGSSGNTAHGGYYPIPTVGWPASDPLVTAVGGTHLQLDADGNRIAPDEVWNESTDPAIVGSTPTPVAGGGGISMFFDRPSYQDPVSSTTGARRGIPDVSLSAAVDGGVLVYLSIPGDPAGFFIFGGTSEASPLFSGIVAIAAQKAGHPLGLLNTTLYTLSSGIVDVTTGDNQATYSQHRKQITVPGYPAVTGYDLASGLGTVDGALLVAALVP